MKLRDVLSWLLTTAGVAGFILVVVSIDSWSTMPLIFLAVLVWTLYIVIRIREYRYQKNHPVPILWMVMPDQDGYRQWVAMDGSGRTRPLNDPPPEMRTDFNQEETPR